MQDYSSERWVTVEEFPNYEISDHGRVRSKVYKDVLGRTHGPHIKKTNGVHYLYADLYDDGFRQRLTVHGIVARAFLSPPESYELELNHKDANKKHNHYKNLEWVTKKQNAQHSILNGRRDCFVGENNHQARLRKEDVREIRKRLAEGAKQSHLAQEFGVCDAAIFGIKTRRSWAWLD